MEIRKTTPTNDRYRRSFVNMVYQMMGGTIGADGTPQPLPSTSMELVIVHQILPDSLEALVTFRNTMADPNIPNDTRKVMILSPFVGDNCKLLILPPGDDSKDPSGANIRTPTQKDLTGLCLNLNGKTTDGSVLIGYVRMTDEGPIPVDVDVYLGYGNSLLKINSDYIEMDNGTSSVKISDDTVEIDAENIVLKGTATLNGQELGG